MNAEPLTKSVLRTLPALAFLIFAIIMVYGSVTMEASFSGTNSHRWVPLGMSLFVCLLAALLLVRQFAVGDSENDSSPIEARNLFFLVLPCIALMAAYAQTHIWFGYVSATLVSGILIFRLFQNGWWSSILQSALATAALYFIFFRLLRLYNPPGRLLDLSLPF